MVGVYGRNGSGVSWCVCCLQYVMFPGVVGVPVTPLLSCFASLQHPPLLYHARSWPGVQKNALIGRGALP